ncbi:hypothetical protein PCANC_22261 [Puccinia coronata f. sp. avenae]|uniref:BPL/LPL catalytic domain-containing protein n=1 Tax=Puccinia coronata f. sp. avenae TaxID=200324 RepID=A0A2N5S616_9BASI|nr:hypothetical protein PCANC_22261 [Puccinia coronata f. sp. avenae]
MNQKGNYRDLIQANPLLMNVLVYSGCTAVTPKASRELHVALRKVLAGSYDVKLANAHLLNNQPWQEHTSLVVFPSLDSSEHDGLVGDTRRTLRQWVGRGGRYLGIGTGAVFAGSHQLELLELTWNLVPPPSLSTSTQSYGEVAFPQHTNQPCGSVKIPIDIRKPTYGTTFRPQDDQATVWARYQNIENNVHQIAGLWIHLHKGYVALVGFDLRSNPERLTEILNLIRLEGLVVSETSSEKPSALYLVSSLSPDSAHEIHRSILGRCTGEGNVLADAQDSFSVIPDHNISSPTSTTNDMLQLFLCLHTNVSQCIMPIFDLKCYFSLIETISSIGNTILFAETVTSTQTMLEKNTKLADSLPNGTVSIAKRQINGRGRGSNNWISTDGSIQFSILVKSNNLGSSVVFVQYLFGLAVIEWIEKFFDGKVLVRLKWPNDIYGSTTGGKSLEAFKKMGGILVNCSFGGLNGTECKLIIGCGLNNHSAPQSSATSLAELIRAARELIANSDSSGRDDLRHPSTEETLAGIFNTFGIMWTQFEAQGFQPFSSLYLARWLHSDQVIRYEKTGEELRIVGIDPSYGLLRTRLIKKSDGTLITREQIVDLQPDSNSFDMFSGLIKSKT